MEKYIGRLPRTSAEDKKIRRTSPILADLMRRVSKTSKFVFFLVFITVGLTILIPKMSTPVRSLPKPFLIYDFCSRGRRSRRRRKKGGTGFLKVESRFGSKLPWAFDLLLPSFLSLEWLILLYRRHHCRCRFSLPRGPLPPERPLAAAAAAADDEPGGRPR